MLLGHTGRTYSFATMAPMPIAARLERATKRTGRGIRFVSGGETTFVGWRELHDEARAVGAELQARGIAPGDHVALLGATSRDLITTIQACWLIGAASMVLPLPMRMASLDEFVLQTRTRIRHGDAKLVLVDDQLAPFYEAVDGDPPLTCSRQFSPAKVERGPTRSRSQHPILSGSSSCNIRVGQRASPRA
jgi:fatty-acyl-CoA synthase